MNHSSRNLWKTISSLSTLLGLTLLNACQIGGDVTCDLELVQAVGDCQRLVCAKDGSIQAIVDDEDAPTDTECTSFTCRDGNILRDLKPAGTVITREPLEDCQRIECDHLGQTTSVPDDTDWTGTLDACIVGGCQNGSLTTAPEGTIVEDLPGDCLITVCDATGKIITKDSELDVTDDMNPCTADICESGKPMHPARPAGTVLESPPGDCRATQCNGAGSTVTVVDEMDVPAEDGITCTTGSCAGGIPSQSASTPGTMCGAEGFVCHADQRCDACPDPGPNCPNDSYGESNDTQAMAYDFGTLNDPDMNVHDVCAVLSGPTDVDWYTYMGHDTLSGLVNPYQYFSNGTKARVCTFFKCNSQNTFLTCPGNTEPSTGPNGEKGCCGYEPYQVDQLGCDGNFNDDARVWIRVDKPEASACTPYFLRFHY